jgi:hypothetical protein
MIEKMDFKAMPIPNGLGMRNNTVYRKQDGTVILVHNKTNSIQLVFSDDLDDRTIGGCCIAIENYGEVLPMTLTINKNVPPIIFE